VLISRYTEGQGFGPHFDEEDVDPTTRLRSHYTLLLYCSAVRCLPVAPASCACCCACCVCCGDASARAPRSPTSPLSPSLSQVSSGGETVFYKSKGREALSVAPEPGLVLVHAQGAHCLLHEGRPVGRGGDKWVLRSDVMVAPHAAQ
jgi:hypothetical protein